MVCILSAAGSSSWFRPKILSLPRGCNWNRICNCLSLIGQNFKRILLVIFQVRSKVQNADSARTACTAVVYFSTEVFSRTMSFGVNVEKSSELIVDNCGSTVLFVGKNLTTFSHLCVAEWVSQEIAPHVITQSSDGLASISLFSKGIGWEPKNFVACEMRHQSYLSVHVHSIGQVVIQLLDCHLHKWHAWRNQPKLSGKPR